MAGRVGVILVHGIGEQKRFEHLETQIRGLIEALKRRPGAGVTVEILSGAAATYQAEQETWAAGDSPSVRITVVEPAGATEINVHEVWWADVNEPYSLAKQIRFWGWGLSVWNFPKSPERKDLAGHGAMYCPRTPGQTFLGGLWVRAKLFVAGLFFLIAAFSLGVVVFLAKRLFGFEAPNFVRVFVNYISGVKLYNQNTRQGGGFLPNPHPFLDTMDDPPRISIRRRMMKTIVAVAMHDEYERWYVLGHSLGSIVSFNGVMENGHAFANYLGQDPWRDLCDRDWAGPARETDWVGPPHPMSPTRPVWLAPNELVYRDRLFERFRGFLTYGSPLGKFAELWPARVPVNKVEQAFRREPGWMTEWINIFDARDPVSGPMKAFEAAELAKAGVTERHCPPMRGLGYKASWVLLLSHIRYLTMRRGSDRQLTDVVADWLVTGNDFNPPNFGVGRWYAAGSLVYWARLVVSWIWWLAAFAILSLAGALVLDVLGLGNWVAGLYRQLWFVGWLLTAWIDAAPSWAAVGPFRWSFGYLGSLLAYLAPRAAGLAVLAALVVFCTGMIARLFFKDAYKDPAQVGQGGAQPPAQQMPAAAE